VDKRRPAPKPARRPTPKPKPRPYLPIPKPPRAHVPVRYEGGQAIVTPIVPAGRSALTLRERVQWRKGGKLVKAGTRGAQKYVTVVQVSRTGKVLRVIDKETPHMVLKTVVPSKIGDFERAGKYQGHIFNALIDASVTSKLHQPNVTRVEVMMRWQDERGKAYREKLTMNMEHIRKRRQFPAALAGLIIETLRNRGYRTQYTVQLFKDARAKGLKHPITWEDWRDLTVVRNLSIVVTIYTR
jgi:hypothetical protein